MIFPNPLMDPPPMETAPNETALNETVADISSSSQINIKPIKGHQNKKAQKKPQLSDGKRPDRMEKIRGVKSVALPEPLPVSDDPSFPILKGCGVLGYRFDQGQIYFLMMRKMGKLDIPGGKLERAIDRNSVDTAVREFNEETRCQAYLYLIGSQATQANQKAWTPEQWRQVQFDADEFFKPIVKDCPILVAQQPAWGVYLVELPFIPTDVFPQFEDEILGFQGQAYQMEWVRLWDFLDKWQLCGRLSSLSFTEAIRKIHARHEGTSIPFKSIG